MLKGILAISGQSGLFKLVAESKNNIIVESLETQKRFPVHSTTKVSSLEDISVFTSEGDIQLSKVLKSIFEKENGGKTMNPKSPDKELRNYFESVLPEYDREKVYISDIKKVLLWYNILNDLKLLDFTEEANEIRSEDSSEEVTEEPGEVKSE